MKAGISMKHIMLALYTLLSVAGCGGGYSEQNHNLLNDTTSITDPSPEHDSEEDTDLWPPNNQPITVSYAQVVNLSQQMFSVEGIDANHIRVAEGADLVEDLIVDRGDFRFITPADPGRNGKIKLLFDGNGIKRSLNIIVATSRPTGIEETTEFDELDTDREPIPLIVKGLGPSNEIIGEDLVFEIGRKIKLDALASNALLNVNQNGFIFLRRLWKPLQTASGFMLSREALENILERLPEGDIDFSITFNGDDEDSDFTRTWAFIANVPTANLEGRVLDTRTGAPIRHLSGRKVAIRGQGANGTRAVTVIDNEGRFGLNGLPAGTYTIELLDTSAPGFTKTFVSIKRNSRHVSVDLEYWSEAYAAQTNKSYKNTIDNQKSGQKINSLDPKTSNLESLVTGELIGEGCYSIFPEGAKNYSFGISSSPRLQAPNNSCEGTMTIPQGVHRYR
ncbi:MAG: carboxypeptidase-like regulatory domain-containing protein [Lautropia sp.]|nr:carboxypeptidase-like regulatory domain-containing protein [Lautropia sp.]